MGHRGWVVGLGLATAGAALVAAACSSSSSGGKATGGDGGTGSSSGSASSSGGSSSGGTTDGGGDSSGGGSCPAASSFFKDPALAQCSGAHCCGDITTCVGSADCLAAAACTANCLAQGGQPGLCPVECSADASVTSRADLEIAFDCVAAYCGDGGPAPCNTVANTASVVAQQNVASAAPTPAGGATIADGTYYVTAWTVYTGAGGASGPTGSTTQFTNVLKSGTYQFVEFISGSNPSSLVQNGTFSTSGSSITIQGTCPSGLGTSPYTAFDNDGTNVTIYTATQPINALVFTKQ
jgi:hypothetical protein